MQVFSSIEAASAGGLRGAAVCLGNFDGVHRGHVALFEAARARGPAVALTFEPHPGRVLQPELAPRLITTRERKLELLEEQGLVAAICQPFSLEYARTTAAEFEASLLDRLGASTLVVGFDFSYGAKRAGTRETLAAAAQARGAALVVVPPVLVEGVVVSSSHIREYILEGRVEAAARLLGRPFDLDGVVVPGAGRGRTIGFPTANLTLGSYLRPAFGVYAVRAGIGDGSAPEWFDGVANLGALPSPMPARTA